MKKFLSVLLAAVMLLGMISVFSACAKKEEGTLICGVTIFEPMNYKTDDGEWTGFDTEFAQLVGEKLGMDVKFEQIEWKAKYSELEAGTISCLWNGFTANAEDEGRARKEYVDFSYSYMTNRQCVVIRSDKAEEYTSLDMLTGKKAAAETGSAGEGAAKKAIGGDTSFVGVPAQIDTLAEVKSGAVDFAVIDILLAERLTGKGNYSDLQIADIELDSDTEVYAVGFKKGSELTEKVNQAMKELYDEGKLTELAEKYNITKALKLDTEFKG
ncbi:MAG: transporter substrate-binding domain-containing protein [Clostridiales bacterium]|nr:transporter substrate-binding domain-containing protein [Clostridiales bacterium]